MVEKLPADWAIERAMREFGFKPEYHSLGSVKHDPTAPSYSKTIIFARYIEAHEEPPVDDLYEAVKAVVEMGRYDTREQVALLRHELDQRGLEIVKRGGAS